MKTKIKIISSVIALCFGLNAYTTNYEDLSGDRLNLMQIQSTYVDSFNIVISNEDNAFSESYVKNLISEVNAQNPDFNLYFRRTLFGNGYSLVAGFYDSSNRSNNVQSIKSSSIGIDFNVSEDTFVTLTSSDFRNEPEFFNQFYMYEQENPYFGANNIANLRDITEMPKLPKLPVYLEAETNIRDNRPTIAFLDTGFLNHEDIYAQNVLGGYRFSTILQGMEDTYRSRNDRSTPAGFLGRGSNFNDMVSYSLRTEEIIDGDSVVTFREIDDCSNPHGLKMKAVATAPISGSGIAGVVDANILVAKVFSTTCNDINETPVARGLLSDVADAIIWAAGGDVSGLDPDLYNVNKPADIINMSLASESFDCPQFLQNAINFAVDRGSIVVTASGNTGRDNSPELAPANCQNVITVTSNDKDGLSSTFSSLGANVNVSVIGDEVLSPSPSKSNSFSTSARSSSDGTSFSAAIFSGFVGLMKYHFNNIDYLNILKSISETSGDVECASFNSCGSGVLNAFAAYEYILERTNFDIDVSPYFDDDLTCEEDLRKQAFESVGINASGLYFVDIENENDSEDYKYQLIRKNVSSDRWVYNAPNQPQNNITEITSFTVDSENVGDRHRVLLRNINSSNFNYAIQLCDNRNDQGMCYVPVDLDI